jgi:hypothetical protein
MHETEAGLTGKLLRHLVRSVVVLCREAGDFRPVGSTAGTKLLLNTPRRRSTSSAPVPRPIKVGIRVFTCLMFGSQGCGKTTLLETLSGCKVRQSTQGPYEKARTSANGTKQGGTLEGEGPDAALLLPVTDQAPQTVGPCLMLNLCSYLDSAIRVQTAPNKQTVQSEMRTAHFTCSLPRIESPQW